MSLRPSSDDALLAYGVLDGAPGPVFVLDSDWVVRYLNHACATVLARDAETLVGQRLFDIVPELLGTPFQSHIERAMSGVPVDFQSYHAPSDRWISIAAHAVTDGVAIFASDITQHRRREEELAAANARLDAILNSYPDLVVAMDRELNFLAFNRAYADAFEQTFGTQIVVGQNVRDALVNHPDARAEAVARWERAALYGEEFVVHRELGADGADSHVYQVRYGSLRDASGTLIGAVSSMNDVTESVRDRFALTELTERLDAVIRYSPDRVVGVDLALRVVAMNEHAKSDFVQLWGIPVEVGDSLREKLSTLPPEQRDAAILMWERAIAGKGVSQFAVSV